MADIPETVIWEPGVYQIETTDPVVGGVPDPLTGAGLSNIPALQLANRTAWLKSRIEVGSFFAAYGGTANAIELTTGLGLTALTPGMEFRFRATAANTAATIFDIDEIGIVTGLTVTGAALPADYIRTDVDTVVRWDGTNIIVSRAIESGSNANGSYTRWEDGTQECNYETFTLYDTVVVGGLFAADTDETWTFPAAYASGPTVVVTGERTVSGLSSDWPFTRLTAIPTTTAATCAIGSFRAATDRNFSTFWIARGRWF